MTFPDAWAVADRIEGWFSCAEGKLLWDAASAAVYRGLPFLEIGSYQGRSASLLLRHQTTILIDSSFLWMNPDRARWDGTADKGYRFEDCQTDLNLQATLCANLVGLPFILIPVPSQRLMIGTPKFGLVFIDGDHNEGGVDVDCDKYLPMLVSGGLAAWHDYEKGNFPDVVEAVDGKTAGWEVFGQTDSLIVKVKP